MIDWNAGQIANFGGTKEMYFPARGNTYPIKDLIKASRGRWDADNKVWMVPESYAHEIEKIMAERGLDKKAEPVREQNLNFAGISKLFSGSKLKRPVITLKAMNGVNIRLSVAGAQSKEPGSIIVTTAAAYGDRIYIGRISMDGTYTGALRYSGQEPVVETLKAFSADPVAVARDYGHKTGRCCFCSKGLTDKRSVVVGYGPVCADNYDLPWGNLSAEEETTIEQGNDALDEDPGNAAEAAMVAMEIERTEHERLMAGMV